MAISVQCSSCGKTFSVSDEFAGKYGKCKSCGRVNVIPASAQAQDTYDLVGDNNADARAHRAVIQNVPAKNVARAEDGGWADLPLAPPSKVTVPDYASQNRPIQTRAIRTKGGVHLFGRQIFGLHFLGLFLVIIGVALEETGRVEYLLASRAKPIPQTITCSQLIHNGYGGNAYLHITSYKLNLQSSFRTNMKHSNEFWVPCDPDSEKLPSIQLIIVCHPDDLQHLKNATFIQGLIVNEVLPRNWERSILQSQYGPSLDVNCLFLHYRRTPSSIRTASVLFYGGLMLIAAALAWMSWGILMER